MLVLALSWSYWRWMLLWKCMFAMLAQLSRFLWYMISINTSNIDSRDCHDIHETVTLFVTHAIFAMLAYLSCFQCKQYRFTWLLPSTLNCHAFCDICNHIMHTITSFFSFRVRSAFRLLRISLEISPDLSMGQILVTPCDLKLLFLD